MNLKDLTFKNIASFIEGYSKWWLDHFRVLPAHEKEQILYRASKCPSSCSKEGKCHYCSCDYPQKLFVTNSCNKGLDLPPLMDKQSWEEYKVTLKNKQNEKNTDLPKTSN